MMLGKKIVTHINHRFSLKYFVGSCLLFSFFAVLFFYQENKDQILEKNLISIAKKIHQQDDSLNKAIFKLQFNNTKNYLQLTNALNALNKHYLLLNNYKSGITQQNNVLLDTELSFFYTQLQKKKQAINQFQLSHNQFNKELNHLLILSDNLMKNPVVNAELKYKIYQIQQLILLRLLNEKSDARLILMPALVKNINTLLIAYPALSKEVNFFLLHAHALLNKELLLQKSIKNLLQVQDLVLAKHLEQAIEQHFKATHNKQRGLQNSLAILIILGIIYVLSLLYAIKIKSDKLNQLLAEIQKQQFALDQHAIVSSADVKGNILYVNDKFCEISGYTREELIGKNHRIVKSNQHSPEEFKQMWRTICRGQVWHGQIKNKKKESGFYWVNASIVPFLDKRGKPYQYISIRTDITLQKELEKKLSDEQNFLAKVTDTMAQGLYALDKKGFCTFWNKEAESILGWSAKELIGKKLHSIIYKEKQDGQPVLQKDCFIYHTVLKNKVYNSEDEFFSHKNGRLLPISITAAPLLEKNTIIGVVAVFSDISKRKADEKIISQAIINAQQASQAKSDFLANMSHEIRTPMNGVIGMTELALGTNLTSEQREYLEIVKDSSTALLGIINDILDFSKIEAGKLALEMIPFDLQHLLKKILAMIITKATDKGLQLRIEALDNLELPTQLIGDPGRLRQVLVNLLGNALKFTEKGSVTLSVSLQEKHTNRCCLLFKVIDTGVGIPEHKQASIFEAFSQADTSVTRKFGGTGLGLSISKQLIELMGGKISVESVPNIKTTFCFTAWFGYVKTPVPLLSPNSIQNISLKNDTSPEVTVSENASHTVLEQKPILHILLAEDNLINQKLAKKVLEKQGHTVIIANDGLEVLALFEQQLFDLILMDFQMPNLNGLDASLKIREIEQQRGGHVLIIAMTANAMQDDKERALKVGMDSYLSKPINVQALLDEINRFFPNRPTPKQVAVEKNQVLETICDWEAALARLGGETDILEMMVGLFLEEQQGYLNAIHTALEAQDNPVLQRELHTLKGICATLGAEKIEAQLRSLEPLAVKGAFEDVTLGLVNVEANLQILTQFLQQKLS